jgi:hypothetical protein
MNDSKARIEKAIIAVDQAVNLLVQERAALLSEVENLKKENARLQDLRQSAISQIDSYLVELEEIRRNHGSRNDSN